MFGVPHCTVILTASRVYKQPLFVGVFSSIALSLQQSSPSFSPYSLTLTEPTQPAAMDTFTTEIIIIASPFPEEQVPVNAEDGGSSSTTKCVIA